MPSLLKYLLLTYALMWVCFFAVALVPISTSSPLGARDFGGATAKTVFTFSSFSLLSLRRRRAQLLHPLFHLTR